jgi:hypothetical protein
VYLGLNMPKTAQAQTSAHEPWDVGTGSLTALPKASRSPSPGRASRWRSFGPSRGSR